MNINTRDFGNLTVNENELITFIDPILGFEKDNRFVLLTDDESDGMFSFLQSVSTDDVCFVLTDPKLIFEDYNPKISKEIEKKLGITAENKPVFRVLTVIPEDFTKATINLKSPLVFCSETKKAAQIVLDDDLPIRTPLVSEEG